ncbi:MAG: DUF885 family protein [Caulobacterales bacterium]|nr:DUF885 family protein [Caulobacterales bacterium]
MRSLIAASLFFAAPALADPPDVLAELAADYQAWRLAENPIAAARQGDGDAARRLPVVTPEAVAARAEAVADFRARAEAISADALTDGERVTLGLLLHALASVEIEAAFDEARVPIRNDSGFHTLLEFLARVTPVRTVEDGEALLARYRDLPRFFDEHIANLQRGVDSGWTQPDVVVGRVVDTLEAMQVGEAGEHALAAPFADLPATIPPAEAERLRADALALIGGDVAEAYAGALQFFTETYRPAARPELAAGSLPEGREWYAARARHFTTLDLTPDEIHAIGLEEVARIRAAMEDIIAEVAFDGAFAEFLAFLRADPQFYAQSADELMREAAWISKRADARMPDLFATLPRLSYGVDPVPDAVAPAYTTGRYIPGDPKKGVAGRYLVNTYDLPARPLYELPALTLHEAVPGHHHQIALAQEVEALPAFRQEVVVTAFSEGWGLYAEHLGYEMGIYRTPYERFGALSYEMWRACRLVVDTGLHWLGWSREEAERCFLENSALSRGNITTEVDRYISWPGQALAYKIGELKLKELRARAEEALGAGFDVRHFHDAVLEDGAVTLAILEAKIDRWIAEQDAGD